MPKSPKKAKTYQHINKWRRYIELKLFEIKSKECVLLSTLAFWHQLYTHYVLGGVY